MKSKKALVTGGEGFVGYHLCKRLNQLGYIVTSLDINLSKRDDRREEGVHYILGDTKDINKIFKEEKFESLSWKKIQCASVFKLSALNKCTLS